MSTNPVSAFLQGFQAVDRLETNRQVREFNEQRMEFAKEDQAFQREARSRTKQLWERQDQEFERVELERFRDESLVEFDATTEQLVKVEIPKLIEEARAKGGDEAAQEVINDWYGSEAARNGRPAGFTKIANEALRRMIQTNPEFGEHITLALGMDAAGGSLVKDKSRPVSSVGIVPAALDPAGRGGMFVEINSVNGAQPMTDNRSAAGNDPVTIKQFGMPELVRVFGKGVMGNQVRIAEVIRDSVGANTPTGNPQTGIAEPQTQTQTPEAPPPAPPMASGPGSAPGGAAERERQAQFEAADAARRGSQSAPTATTESLQGIQDAQQMREESRATLNDDSAPASSKTAAVIRHIGGTILEAKDTMGAASSLIKDMMWASGQDDRERAAAAAKFVKDVAVESFTGERPTEDAETPAELDELLSSPKFRRDVQSENFSGNKAKDEATANGKGIVSDNATPSDYTRAKVGKPGADATNAALRAPFQVSPQAAQRVQATNKPGFVEIYDALGLMKASQLATGGKGGITMDAVMRYANTGRWGEAAKRDLQKVSDGGITTIIDMTGDAAGMGRPVAQFQTGALDTPEGQGPPKISDHAALNNYIQDVIPAPLFGEGDRAKAAQAKAISAMTSAMKIAMPEWFKSEAGLSQAAGNVRTFQAGMDIIRGFNPDRAQNLFEGTGDFNPFSDPEFPMSPGAIALGTYAATMGIEGKSADEFLVQASDVLKIASRQGAQISSRDLVATMDAVERDARKIAAERKISQDAARREAVEERFGS